MAVQHKASEETNEKVTWQDPPPSKRGRSTSKKRLRFVEQLKECPGKWALYNSDGVGLSSSAASALKKAHPELEVTSRIREDRKFDVYVRFVP
jgi:hypothetical protein